MEAGISRILEQPDRGQVKVGSRGTGGGEGEGEGEEGMVIE